MRRSMVVVAVLVGVVSGCAGPGVAPAPPAPTSPVAPTVQLPPRPREVRLDDLDPCTLLTAVDRVELGLDQPSILDVGPSTLYGGTTSACSIRGYEPRAIAVGVELSVTGGIELFFRPGLRSEVIPIEVRGFPGVTAIPVPDRFCTVVVDVAPGQLVDVQVRDGGRVPPVPQHQLCADAERVANLVMGNVLALR